MTGDSLIPADRAQRKQRHSHTRAWAVLCGGYTLLVVLGLALCGAVLDGGDVTLADKRNATHTKIRKFNASIKGMQRSFSEVRDALEASRAIGSQPDWSVLFVLLGKELDEVILNGYELIPLDDSQPVARAAGPDLARSSPEGVPLANRRFILKINGFGQTQTAVSQFVLRLESIELFENVRLVKSNRQAFLDKEAVAFTIECMI